ncbi:putative baseplate assembly protein [Desulfosporosinus sp. PR]|uniref:putative baseplate assembly protein n=1 Tax=Candidatus Desulfosporosinus nitrosoreducens TaxID=3401928 RepID=UPI0027F3768A|nr:putative baseplate assembly protein [Desulfosporosinus sp. PR]MDQ7096752.1 putative baseplate assembly protein [Desulfosporosinus sp. PR]
MLNLPNYDDQSFEAIMEAAKRRIPVLYPQWTDMNEHDPGITILELFAWLKEMQQFYLNRITIRGYENMLALLGTTVGEPAAAQAYLVFPEGASQGSLPQGMRFETSANIIFESRDSVTFNKAGLKSIYVYDGRTFRDVQDLLREPGIYCQAFGQNPLEGESSLYIGVDQWEEEREFSLFLLFDDHYPVARNPFQNNSRAPREIVWEFGAGSTGQIAYKPLEILADETHAFAQTGKVVFRLPAGAAEFTPAEGLPRLYWLRARLARKGCEENPRLQNIYQDPIAVLQQQTLCETLSFTWLEKGEAELELDTWLSLQGRLMVFVRDKLGWRLHNEVITYKQTEENTAILRLKLRALPQELALDGAENIKVLCYEEDFASSMVLAVSSGLPGQRFSLPNQDTLLRELLSVMVKEETDEGQKCWSEWNYVADLAKAGPYDRCFSYDPVNQEIVFGDNEQGAVPQAGENNIIVTRCVITKGSIGNIPSQNFKPLNYSAIANPLPASGGKDAEQLNEALERIKASLKKIEKAVTASDYETLAAATPGHRIMGVKAIPYYDPDSRSVGDKQAPATVTVVVLPYSEEPFPLPDESLLQAVREQLEAYRLITTNVKVISPLYVKISVYIEVSIEYGQEESSETVIRAAIERFFEGIRKGIPTGKPEFGQPVRESMLARKIEHLPGVVQVKRVALAVRNNDSYKDNYGDVIIPPQALPALGDLQIRLIV